MKNITNIKYIKDGVTYVTIEQGHLNHSQVTQAMLKKHIGRSQIVSHQHVQINDYPSSWMNVSSR